MDIKTKQSFMQGIVTLIFSQFIIKIFGLFYKLYLTNNNKFGDIGNAIYNAGFQIYALILTITSIGIPNAIAKLIAEKKSKEDFLGVKKIFRVSFIVFSLIGFVGSLILYFGSNYIANNILVIKEARLTLMILAPSVFFEALIACYRGYFNGNQDMRPQARSQELEQIVKTIFTIVIVEVLIVVLKGKSNLEKLSAGASLAITISTIISFLYLSNKYRKKRKEIENIKNKEKNKYNKMRKYEELSKNSFVKVLKEISLIAIPLTVTSLLSIANKNIDSITVVRNLKKFMSSENAKIQYGILSGKIDTIINLPLSFNIAIATVLIPSISEEKAKDNMENIKKRILFSILMTILVGMACTLGLILYANPIMELFFPNASNGDLLLKISSISIIFIAIEQTINGALQGLGKVNVPLKALLVGLFIKLILNIILLKLNPNKYIIGGIMGATIATIISHMFSTFISFKELKKCLKIKISINKFFLKPIIVNLLMVIISFCVYNFLLGIFSKNLAIILVILISVLIYIIFLFMFKIFDKEELYMIPYYYKIEERLANKRIQRNNIKINNQWK